MQAITTKYLPATNTKGSRIKASCEAGSVTVSFDHTGTIEQAHAKAAITLIAKLGWHGEYTCAGDRNGCYYFAEIVRGTNVYTIAQSRQERLKKAGQVSL